jgi:hypothetical protein
LLFEGGKYAAGGIKVEIKAARDGRGAAVQRAVYPLIKAKPEIIRPRSYRRRFGWSDH